MLSDRQLFSLNIGLIIGEQNGFYIDSLEFGQSVNNQKENLEHYWGIIDNESAIEYIESRIAVGHRKLYNELCSVLVVPESNNIAKIIHEKYQDDAEDIMDTINNLMSVLNSEIGKDWFKNGLSELKIETDAWDFARLIFVCRVAFTLGYISKSAAAKYMEEITKLTRKKFKNWEEFAKSYLLGRAFWCGNDYGETGGIASIAETCLKSKKSPWYLNKW